MADNDEKPTTSDQSPMLKISQVASVKRSLPMDVGPRAKRAMPTRNSTKQQVNTKRPEYGLLLAKSLAQSQQQKQHIKNLEHQNVGLRSMLKECRESIVTMTSSMHLLLRKVDNMLEKDLTLNKKPAKPKASSPPRNGDSSTRKHQLPITTLDGFKIFEKNLMNKDFFSNAVNSLRSQKLANFIDVSSKLGKQDPETVMIFITKILLAPQVLGQFKWTRRWNDPPDELIFRKFDFFRSLFMTLVNKTCFRILTQTIDQKAYENFFRTRIQREACQLQKLIKTQIRELRASSLQENDDEMEEHDTEHSQWQGENGSWKETVAYPILSENFEAEAEIKQEPIDFVDVMQSSSLVDTSIVKEEPTDVDETVFNAWSAESDNEI